MVESLCGTFLRLTQQQKDSKYIKRAFVQYSRLYCRVRVDELKETNFDLTSCGHTTKYMCRMY